MDYSNTAYFQGAPPYQQFGGTHISPLTPAHSNSVASDEFNNTSSPVGCVPTPPAKTPQIETEYMMRPEQGACLRFLYSAGL